MRLLNTAIVGASAAALAAALAPVALAQEGETAETPRTADGRPDLNGTWDNGSGIDFVNPVFDGESVCLVGCAPRRTGAGPPLGPDRPSYRPELHATVADLEARQVEEDPVLRCNVPGLPRIGPPDKIVQQQAQIVFLYEDVTGDAFRIVPMDGRAHRTDVEPAALGDAVGRWDGDTLVVETVNFTDDTWLTDDGSFHTASLRVEERITRNGDAIEWRAIAHDPDILTEPWALHPRTAYLTDVDIAPSAPCIERDLEHIVDGTHHDNPR
jgi:hypothetical protein